MSLLGKAVYRLINGKKEITEPIFLKEFQRENDQLKDLMELSKRVSSNKKEFIERDITYLKQGLDGEKNVCYELKNSFIPMLCLHDIRLEYNDYAAQFDFILITNKFIMVLETKKLNGDIEINKDGDFIRKFKNRNGRVFKEEGMYSPILQNERHVNILKEILIKKGIIKTMPIKSAVIIANPKTIVNKSKAPKDIQNSIFKYDQISNLLKKELSDKTNEKNLLEKYLYEIGNFLLQNNKPITIDYKAKYSLSQEDFIIDNTKTIENSLPQESIIPNEERDDNKKSAADDEKLYELLKKYRLDTSRAEGVKPYFIFNNAELEELIQTKPKTKEELIKVKGFGPVKVKKYGEEILGILKGEM